MLFSLRVPANNGSNPQNIEQVLDALHAGNTKRHRIELAIARHSDEIMLYCRLPDTLSSLAISQIHASYPDAKIETVADHSLRCRVGHHRYSARLYLTPPPEEQEDRLEIIRRASRHRYTQPIKRVIAELDQQFANV